MLILGDDVGWLRLLDLGVHAEDAHPPQGATFFYLSEQSTTCFAQQQQVQVTRTQSDETFVPDGDHLASDWF